MCIYDSPPTHCNEVCGHLAYSRPLEQIISSMQTLPPLPSVPVHDVVSISAFENYVTLNADMLAEIHGQMHSIKTHLTSLSTEVANVKVASGAQVPSEEAEEGDRADVLDTVSLQAVLTTEVSFHHALRLFSEFRPPIYKNKPFGLKLKAIDQQRTPLCFAEPTKFQVKVFKATRPPEEITASSDLGAFLAGQVSVQVSETDEVVFRDLQFIDVTSNYPENWVFVCVQCISDPSIKPLVLEGVRVKARKPIVSDCS